MMRYAFAIGLAGIVGYGFVSAPQAQCGSAPNEEQITRRRLAIITARQINTAEAQAFSGGRKYLPLTVLEGVTLSDGFEAQVSTDGESYAFSVKDMRDACHAAVFSDQKGVIYTGMAIQ